MRLPKKTAPRDAPEVLWALQQHLLRQARKVLWPPDATKTIYQPVFTAHGPLLRNTPAMDGAFAELSPAGQTYWPTVVYELAHETVHLLDPSAAPSYRLEEGVAVEFSVYMQHQLRLPPKQIQQPRRGRYLTAWQLVRQLPEPVFDAARRLRAALGPLGTIKAHQLRAVYPELAPGLAEKICRKMPAAPRPRPPQ